MEEKTDKDLYREFLSGNKESFEQLVIRYKDRLIYFIQRYVRNVEIAEDLAQDVFVYLLIHKENYDFKYSLKTYLYTIAKSKSINYIKRERRITYVDEKDFMEFEELEEKVFKKEQKENLIKDIQKLKIDYQNVIYLIDIEELKYKEVAKVLNKTLPQVKILIYRARRALEEIVRKEAGKYEG